MILRKRKNKKDKIKIDKNRVKKTEKDRHHF